MSAVISNDQQYRYKLSRLHRVPWEVRTPAIFCMLNPSTADGAFDDPTIRTSRGGVAGTVRIERQHRRHKCDSLERGK